MLIDLTLDVLPEFFQLTQRRSLILLHRSRVSYDIGKHNGSQLANGRHGKEFRCEVNKGKAVWFSDYFTPAFGSYLTIR
jgi:hypothetical protein